MGPQPCVKRNRWKKTHIKERKRRYDKQKIKILYSNANGLKSKLESLCPIIEELDPTIICITEPKIKTYDGAISIKGYCDPIELRRQNKQGGGIWIIYKKSLKDKITVLEVGDDDNEQVWINIRLGCKDIILGLVYGKQESRTRVNSNFTFFDKIDYYAVKAKNEGKALIILGDFNVKIGDNIKGNHPKITTGGKKLMKIVNKRKLNVLNTSDKCQGLWTRVSTTDKNNVNKKAILDYALVNQKGFDKFDRMIIDEDRRYVLERVGKYSIKESDHNTMVLDFNFKKKDVASQNSKKERGHWVLSNDSLMDFDRQVKTSKIGSVWDQNKPVNVLYKEWKRKLYKIMGKCFKKRYNRTTKHHLAARACRELRKKKVELKQKLSEAIKNEDNLKETVLKIRIKHLNKKLVRTENESKDIRMKANIEKLSGIVVQSSDFYKIRAKILGRKADCPTAVINEQGKELVEQKEILEEHETYFEKLLTNREPDDKYKNHVKSVEKLFSKVIQSQKGQRRKYDAPFEMWELEKVLKSLKVKKSPGVDSISNEIYTSSGYEFKSSVLKAINKVFTTGQPPKDWRKIIVRTIYKKKGNRKVLKNWRGIFLTVSISKIYEKLMLNRQISVIEKGFSEAAAGGRKDRSTLDHLFIWQAINDYYKYLKCSVKFVYLDLEKAFDKLWLKSCIIDMFRSGVKGNFLTNVYELNNEGYIQIHTPSGITGEVKIKENLKQGTILAAPICANHIDKGMQIVKKENLGINFGNILIPPLLYQDDILIASVSHKKNAGNGNYC